MATDSNNNNNKEKKRKRVNRMKYFIILFAVILLFTSVILNFILMFKVMHLEEQMDQLYSFVRVTNNILC